jgi:MFS family permease
MIDRARMRGGVESTLRSFEIRNFRLFFGGQLVSQVGNWLTLIAQTLFVLHLTGNNGVAVGVLTACQFLPVLVLGAWAGLVADRSDKRKLLLYVQVFAMVQSFAMAALAFTGDPPLLAIYAVAMAGGVATAFDNPARRSFVVEMVPATHVQNAVSLNSALMTSARVIGPPIAGLLIVTSGYGWCFAIDGLTYIAVLVAYWRMNTDEIVRSESAPQAKGQIREGLRYVRSETDLFVPLVMTGIIGTFAMNFPVVFPLFVKEDLGGTDTMFTILYGVVAVGSLAGALVAARRTSISHRDVVRGAVLFGVSLMVRQHRRDHDDHGDGAARHGTRDARAGARPAGDGAARQHADRGSAARIGVRGVRRTRRVRGRLGCLLRRRRVGRRRRASIRCRRGERGRAGVSGQPGIAADSPLTPSNIVERRRRFAECLVSRDVLA